MKKPSAMLAMLSNGIGNSGNNNAPLDVEKGQLMAKLNLTRILRPATSSAVAETVSPFERIGLLHRAAVTGGVSYCAAVAATTSNDIGDVQHLRRRSQARPGV
jgi:hypothetical protein